MSRKNRMCKLFNTLKKQTTTTTTNAVMCTSENSEKESVEPDYVSLHLSGN